VGTYVIMPDHIHLFCRPAGFPAAEGVKAWTSYWKRLASLAMRDLQPLWQADCWDTQMRDIEHYNERLSYVRQNPVRRELVQRAEDWPYQGELNSFAW
jgi:putative transposase